MSMMPDLSWFYPQEPDPVAEAQRLREQYRMAQELFPMPEQVRPQLGPEPGSTFGDQLALGIAQTPVPPMRGFLPNLIAGASRGYASARLAGMKSRAASNQQARADAAAANEANSRATLDLRRGWLNHVSDASKAYQAWKLEALKGAMKPALLTPEAQGKQDAAKIIARNRDLKAAGQPIPGEGGIEGMDLAPNLNANAIDLAARMYLTTGQLPPMGMGKAGVRVRETIINRAGQLAPEGTDLAANKASFSSSQQSLSGLQKIYDSAKAFESTALKNANVMLGAMAKIPDTGAPWLNAPLRSVNKSGLGSADQAAFEVAIRTVQPEFARILNSPTMAGQLTDNARQELEAALSPNATMRQMVSAIDVLKRDAHNRTESYKDQIDEIRGRIRGIGKPAAADTAVVKWGRDANGRPVRL